MISSEPTNTSECSTIIDLIKNNLFSINSKIFQNESVLLDDYLPETLLHREKAIKHFGNYCKGIIKPTSKQHFYPLIIKGEPGTGKTTLTKLCVIQLISIAQSYGVQLRYIHLNCRKIQKVYVMLITILKTFKTFKTFYSERGYSHEELFLQIQNILERSNIHLVLAFDDLDYMLKTHDPKELMRFVTLLTEFFEAPANLKEKLSLIFIIHQSDFFFRLDVPTRILVQSSEIDLPVYTREQLIDIFQIRVGLAFQPYVVPDWFTTAIVDILDCLKQDIRTGLNFLLNIGRTAEFKDVNVLTAEGIREVLYKMYDWDTEVEFFSLEEQLMLLTVTKLLTMQKNGVAVPITHVKSLYQTLNTTYQAGKTNTRDFNSILQCMNNKKGILLYNDTIILCCPVNVLLPRLECLFTKQLLILSKDHQGKS